MLEKILNGIEKPGRYAGGETNACRKDFESAEVRFALAFPDAYEVGLSHLGVRLLYHMLNGLDGVMADRAYAPWFDLEERLRALHEPLWAVESERPLKDFDFVGFSLQYELSYSNILTMLDLGGIPLRAKDRTTGDPWVIAGGPCAFNPEPLAEFFDFFVIGEAEEVMREIVLIYREWKQAGGSRNEFLRELRKIPGIYVPSFFDISYHPDGRLASVEPLYDDYASVGKRLVLDLDGGSPIPERPLVPILDIVHNRLGVEIARGCTRGCRFCQAGFIYRPVRERDPQRVLNCAEQAVRNSGFEEVSLLSLSTGDYCQIQALLSALMERFTPERVAVSFPSMRVGTLTPELMQLIRQVRKTGFTLAPEAGSERLRRVINKGIQDNDLLAAAESAFQLGWRVLKLYFMTGLPTERHEDLDSLIDLCMKVWKLGKASRSSVNVSVSTFVPKPHTPFQWVPQLEQREIEDHIQYLRERLNRPGMRFKWNHPSHSLLEAVFARGDRRLADTLEHAWKLGARFDGWTEKFRQDIWAEAFRSTGMEPSFYASRERSRDEILPWDHLSAGVEKEFLWDEYAKAHIGEFTPDCRFEGCSACGVCDHKEVRPRLQNGEGAGPVSAPRALVPKVPEEDVMYWLRYSKLGNIRFFGQLEVAQVFDRAIRRAELPAAFSKGFHPHVRLSFVEALPLGFESLAEEVYLSLTEKLDPESVKEKLNQHLPEGIRIEDVAHVMKRLARRENLRVTYRVADLHPWMVRSVIQNWRRRIDEPLVKKTKRGEVKAELGDVLLDVRQLDDSTIEMDLHEASQGCFRPTAIMKHLLDESPGHFSECRICKVATG